MELCDRSSPPRPPKDIDELMKNVMYFEPFDVFLAALVLFALGYMLCRARSLRHYSTIEL